MKHTNLTHNIKNLDTRTREVFKQIVENYLNEGEPIGSRNLARLLPQNISPATVRNVMSDLEDLGLIAAPHVSAGRLPTQTGLRFFIDSFLEVGKLPQEERKILQTKIYEAGRNQSIEQFLTDASQILSDVSNSAGVVVTNKQETKLKYIEFVQLDQKRALVVLITQKGDIENRIISLPKGVKASELIEASNYLNSYILNKTLAQARREINKAKEQTECALHSLSHQLVEKGVAVFGGEGFDKKMRLIIHGRSNLLENIKEKEDLERVKQLFDDLETHETTAELLELIQDGSGVRIFIGAENKLFSLSESSLIVAPYKNADQQIIGAVGVIGPTRLNYARIVPMVNYTAQLITHLLK